MSSNEVDRVRRTPTTRRARSHSHPLHEAHHVSAYEAVDRLVRAGETAGFDVNALLGMLDQGIDFRELLELIVSKSAPLSLASPDSKRKPAPAQPAQLEQALRQLVIA